MHLEHSVHNRPLEEMEKNYTALGSGGGGGGDLPGPQCSEEIWNRTGKVGGGGVRVGSAVLAEPHQ